jgi:hypothetical protein
MTRRAPGFKAILLTAAIRARRLVDRRKGVMR